MITSVEIQNFKNLRHQEIGLEPLTVFVGANGSGKTSVLEAIHLAVRAATAAPESARSHERDSKQLLFPYVKPSVAAEKVFRRERHCDWLYTRGGQGDLVIVCRTQPGVLTVKATPPSQFPPPSDLMGKGDWKLYVNIGIDPQDLIQQEAFGIPNFNVNSAEQQLLQLVHSLVFLHLNPAQLARASYSDLDPPRIEDDGKGLASVLAYMALNDPDAFDELISHMRIMIPNLKRIRFRKAGIIRREKELLRFGREGSVERRTSRLYRGEAILFDFKNAENLAAHTVSEGTLMLLGLLAALLGPSHPKILLMDDIEHGLHPLAQKSLLDVLRQVTRNFPDLQILATAHSPYLVDHLRPEEVRLMTVGEDGYAVCGRLVDHPQFNKWKDEMAPGELWSLFGEKWLAEGVPVK